MEGILDKISGPDKLRHAKELKIELEDEIESLLETAKTSTLSDSDRGKFHRKTSDLEKLNAYIADLEPEHRRKMNKATKILNGGAPGDSLDDGRIFLDKAKTISMIGNKTKLSRLYEAGEGQEIGLGELILAKIRGPQNAAEKSALDTSLDASGGITTKVSRNFWDSARAASTVVRAGAQVLDFENDGTHGTVKIPQITGDPTASWKVQNVEQALSDPTFTAKSFDFKTLFAAVQISNEVAQDSGDVLAQMITASLSRSFASEIDRAALLGSGVGEEPQGIALKAINEFSMGTNGGDLEDFNSLVGAIRLCMDDNTPLERINGFIMAPRTWQDLASLKSATELQQLMMPQQIQQIPWYVSSKIPINQTQGSSSNASSIYVGDFTQLVIGVRLSVKVRFFEQPLAQSFSTLVTCATRVDFEAINLGAFCKITGIIPGPALT